MSLFKLSPLHFCSTLCRSSWLSILSLQDNRKTYEFRGAKQLDGGEIKVKGNKEMYCKRLMFNHVGYHGDVL